MANVTFDLKDLKSAGYEAEKLVELLPTMGIEVEEIDETEITVNVTPNRPDLLDYVGFVRAVDCFTGKKIPREGTYEVKNEPALMIEVTKEVQKVRPYIAGVVAKNVDLSGNLVKYMINFTNKFADTYGRRRKKIGMGVHDLDKIKGTIVYDAAADGKITPLEHQKEVSFADVVAQHEKGVEYGGMYGNKKIYPFIRDSEKTLVLVPIVQCEQTKATANTKDIFIEITGTSKNAVEDTVNMVACSLIYSGADVYPVIIKYDGKGAQTPKLEYKEIRVSMKRADATLGVETGRHDIVKLANKMGYVAAKLGNNVMFYVPPFRIDVLNEQDVIEDIAIAYGYDNIVPLPVLGQADGLPSDISELENKIAEHMVGLGYLEVVNSILTNEKTNFVNMTEKYNEDNYIKIADAKTSEISMVRCALLPGMLKNLEGSANERMPFKIFEIGRIFWVENGSVKERLKLAIASQHAKANFAEIKGVVESLMKYLETDYKLEPHKRPAFIDGRCAKAMVDGNKKAVFGEIHPRVLGNFGLGEPVVAATITLVDEIKYEA